MAVKKAKTRQGAGIELVVNAGPCTGATRRVVLQDCNAAFWDALGAVVQLPALNGDAHPEEELGQLWLRHALGIQLLTRELEQLEVRVGSIDARV